VKVAEIPVAGRKPWKFLVPAAVVLVAAAIVGGFYFHSRRTLTEKDSIVLAEFTNTTATRSSTVRCGRVFRRNWSSRRF
jgi:hypothetical protein